MIYAEDQIKKYLEILHNYTKKPVEELSRKTKCWNCQNTEFFLFIQDIKFVITVMDLMVMYQVSMMLKIAIDYIFEKRVFIKESITMRKRLIKFLKNKRN